MAYGHDFEMPVSGRGSNICYNITDKAKKTVCVTYHGSIADEYMYTLEGNLVIPEKVTYEGVEYTVTEIGSKAFSYAEGITSVEIPSTVRSIGGFAFEYCKNLQTVILPSRQPAMGSGVFFDCPSITTVDFGSDWKEVNLTMFRWSDKLAEITIPRSVTKITGMDKLKGLKAINVAGTNMTYKSVDGILYDKSGRTLIYCPRNYGETIKIADGCETVENGALEACLNTKKIIIPASVKQISFHQTFRMKELEEIEIEGSKPLYTATMEAKKAKGEEDGDEKNAKAPNTRPCFFQLLNPKTVIYVDKTAKDAFIKALPEEEGSFLQPGSDEPIKVTKNQIPTKSNFKNL